MLVIKHKPPDHPALRAPRGRRNFDLFVERKVLRFDDEALFTVLANLSFDVHILERLKKYGNAARPLAVPEPDHLVAQAKKHGRIVAPLWITQ